MGDEIDEAAKLIEAADHYGPLHLAVDDGNMEDSDLDFCERDGAPISSWSKEDRDCLTALRALSEDDRYEAWERHNDLDWRTKHLSPP